MKIFITGADGLLGSSIVRATLQKGHDVKAFLLPGSNQKSIEGLEIERCSGNILNPDEIHRSIHGCDAVIHAAADTSVWPSRSKRVWAVNVTGTKNMLDASQKAGVQRFVHIGSASSFGFGTKENPGDETTPFKGGKYGLDYIDSKLEGQNSVARAAKENGFPGIVVTPTFMFGPYDSKPGSGKMILAVYQKKLPAFTGGGRNFVSAKDVAAAVANALTLGRIGECYIAGNANLSYREITTIIAEEVGATPPRIQLPDILMKMTGLLASAAAKTFKFEPKVSYPMAKIACDGQYLSPKKAVQELNMPQTDIRVAIREAFDWFKTNGYC